MPSSSNKKSSRTTKSLPQFSIYSKNKPLLDLLEIQRKSFFDLLEHGIAQELAKMGIFRETAKNSTFIRELELVFNPETYKLVSPNCTSKEAILKGKTYACKLYVQATLTVRSESREIVNASRFTKMQRERSDNPLTAITPVGGKQAPFLKPTTLQSSIPSISPSSITSNARGLRNWGSLFLYEKDRNNLSFSSKRLNKKSDSLFQLQTNSDSDNILGVEDPLPPSSAPKALTPEGGKQLLYTKGVIYKNNLDKNVAEASVHSIDQQENRLETALSQSFQEEKTYTLEQALYETNEIAKLTDQVPIDQLRKVTKSQNSYTTLIGDNIKARDMSIHTDFLTNAILQSMPLRYNKSKVLHKSWKQWKNLSSSASVRQRLHLRCKTGLAGTPFWYASKIQLLPPTGLAQLSKPYGFYATLNKKLPSFTLPPRACAAGPTSKFSPNGNNQWLQITADSEGPHALLRYASKIQPRKLFGFYATLKESGIISKVGKVKNFPNGETTWDISGNKVNSLAIRNPDEMSKKGLYHKIFGKSLESSITRNYWQYITPLAFSRSYFVKNSGEIKDFFFLCISDTKPSVITKKTKTSALAQLRKPLVYASKIYPYGVRNKEPSMSLMPYPKQLKDKSLMPRDGSKRQNKCQSERNLVDRYTIPTFVETPVAWNDILHQGSIFQTKNGRENPYCLNAGKLSLTNLTSGVSTNYNSPLVKEWSEDITAPTNFPSFYTSAYASFEELLTSENSKKEEVYKKSKIFSSTPRSAIFERTTESVCSTNLPRKACLPPTGLAKLIAGIEDPAITPYGGQQALRGKKTLWVPRYAKTKWGMSFKDDRAPRRVKEGSSASPYTEGVNPEGVAASPSLQITSGQKNGSLSSHTDPTSRPTMGANELVSQRVPLGAKTKANCNVSNRQKVLLQPFYTENGSNVKRSVKNLSSKFITHIKGVSSSKKAYGREFLDIQEDENVQTFRPWIFLGELPLMTKRGHFILNGSPRVIVNQIARCPGIYFQEKRRGVGFEQEVRVSADLIPQRGPWLRIQSDWEGRFWARLKQEGRVKYATLYQAFQEFEKQYNAPLVNLVTNNSSSFPKSEVIAFQERKAKEDRQKKALVRLFKNSMRYSLGEQGRFRINQRVHSNLLSECIAKPSGVTLTGASFLKPSIFQQTPPGVQTNPITHKKHPLYALPRESKAHERDSAATQALVTEPTSQFASRSSQKTKMQVPLTSESSSASPYTEGVNPGGVPASRVSQTNAKEDSSAFYIVKNQKETFTALPPISSPNNCTNLETTSLTNPTTRVIPGVTTLLPFPPSVSLGLLSTPSSTEEVMSAAHSKTSSEKSSTGVLLMGADIGAVHTFLERLLEGQGFTDDIDHLKNRFIRTSGKLLQQQFELGLHRLNEVVMPLLGNLIQGQFLSSLSTSVNNSIPLAPSLDQRDIPTSRVSQKQPSWLVQPIGKGKKVRSKNKVGGKSDYNKAAKDKLSVKLSHSLPFSKYTPLPDTINAHQGPHALLRGSSLLRTKRILFPNPFVSAGTLRKAINERFKSPPVSLEDVTIFYPSSKIRRPLGSFASPNPVSLFNPLFADLFLTDSTCKVSPKIRGPNKITSFSRKNLDIDKSNFARALMTATPRATSGPAITPSGLIPRRACLPPTGLAKLITGIEDPAITPYGGQQALRGKKTLRGKDDVTRATPTLIATSGVHEKLTPKSQLRKPGGVVQKKMWGNKQHILSSSASPMRLKSGITEVASFRWLRTSKPVNGAFREFFGSNPLSQYMDQTNPLAEITHKRRLNSMGPGGIKRETAGMEVRGIHPTHYGRVCPIETPEGKNAGLVNSPTVYGRVGSGGFLETPLYQVVENQVQMKRWAFFSAQQEEDEESSLATCDTGLVQFNFLPPVPIPVQTANNPLAHFQQVERNRVGYRALSPVQTISIATALIPFLEHDDANRALMGSNMQRQAIPLLSPERPIVGTGFEPIVIIESGQALQATKIGCVSHASANKIILHTIHSIGKALPQSVLRNYSNLWGFASVTPVFVNSGNTPTHISGPAITPSGVCLPSPRVSTGSKIQLLPPTGLAQLSKPKGLDATLKLSRVSKKRAESFITNSRDRVSKRKKDETFVFNNFFISDYSLTSGDSISKMYRRFFHIPTILHSAWWNRGIFVRHLQCLETFRLLLPRAKANFAEESSVSKSFPLKVIKNPNWHPTLDVPKTTEGSLASSHVSPQGVTTGLAKLPMGKQIQHPVGFKIGHYLANGASNVELLWQVKKFSWKKYSLEDIFRLFLSPISQTNWSTPLSYPLKYPGSLAVNDRNVLSTNSTASSVKQMTRSHFETYNNEVIFEADFGLLTSFVTEPSQFASRSSQRTKMHVPLTTSTYPLKGVTNGNSASPYTESVNPEGVPASPMSHANAKEDNNKVLFEEEEGDGDYVGTKGGQEEIEDFLMLRTNSPKEVSKPKGLPLSVVRPKEGLEGSYYPLRGSASQRYSQSGYAPRFTKIQLLPPTGLAQLSKPYGVRNQVGLMEDSLSSASPLESAVDLKENFAAVNSREHKEVLTISKNIPHQTKTRFHLCSTHNSFLLRPVEQPLQIYQRSNQETCLSQRPLVQEGDWVQKGDFLADCSSSDLGDLALGKNVTVAYMPWEGYNFEDAIVISDRLVADDVYTSIHIERYEIKVSKNSQGKERITNQIPSLPPHSLKHLDNSGIARLSSWVQPGDILVGKVVELKRPLSPYERLAWELASRLSPTSPEREKWLNKVWLEDISLRLPPGVYGRVINSQIVSTEWSEKEQVAHPLEVHIYLAIKRKIQVGDKLAGRHGNKGIVSIVLPRQDMPYLGDGSSVDMVLNPLGVPSRMNLGQIFECLLGLAGSQLGCNFKVTPFDEIAGGEASRSLVFLKLYQCRLMYKQQWLFTPTFPGKSKLFDGRTGEPFENWVTVGQAYMLKLIHMVDHKIHARSTGPYSLFTRQPVRGRSRRGGQRLGEMEVWAVEGFGAAYTLQEFLTIKSDDLKARAALQRGFYKQNDVTLGKVHISPGNPEAFKVLVSELQALCLHIQM